MKLKNIEWSNIKSFGNAYQKLEFSDEGGLYLILGKNGYGKCISGETKLQINIDDKIVRQKFLEFLSSRK
jgi:hypothetical protein